MGLAINLAGSIRPFPRVPLFGGVVGLAGVGGLWACGGRFRVVVAGSFVFSAVRTCLGARTENLVFANCSIFA